MKATHWIFILLIGFLSQTACTKIKYRNDPSISFDQVHQHYLENVRLGDGVPLSLDLSIRWKIKNKKAFIKQFPAPSEYNSAVLLPRMQELANAISNQYESVDSVFSPNRQTYIHSLKEALRQNLGEKNIEVKEVILSNIYFPQSYTDAMERVGLQKQELDRIKHQNRVDLERSAAAKKKAEADALVAIAQAEAEAKLQNIRAKTEESSRKSALAKAETESQVDKMRVVAEAERRRVIAAADLDKQRDQKDLEIQKKRELHRLELDRMREQQQLEFDHQIQFAKLCTENPVYASFLVNRELASKVEIAVLPTGSDPTIFGNVLKNTMNNN